MRSLKIFTTLFILVLLSLFIPAHTATQRRTERETDIDSAGNQGEQGIEALVGLWRDNLDTDNTSHYRFQLKGKEILVLQVSDKDDLDIALLKGEEVEYAIFKLEGRRIIGKMTGNKWMKPWKGNPIRGFVSEDFREIKWEYPLIGTDVGGGRPAYSQHTLRRLKQ